MPISRRAHGDIVIAHSSDIHVDDGYTARAHGGDGTRGLRHVLETAKAAKADIALLVGDIFEHKGADVSDIALPGRKGRGASGAPHPFATSPLRHLMFAVRETAAADNSPEPGRQYLRDTFGQAYWSKREGFVALLEWFAALGNAEGMTEWLEDSEAARILAGRLRNDHA